MTYYERLQAEERLRRDAERLQSAATLRLENDETDAANLLFGESVGILAALHTLGYGKP